MKKKNKTGIPLHTPILVYKKWGLRGYTFHGHVYLMLNAHLIRKMAV